MMLTKTAIIRKNKKKLLQKILLTDSGESMPVFIFGAQRSGTNMLVNALDKNLEVTCYHESDDEAFNDYVLRKDFVNKLIEKSNGKVTIFKSISDSQCAKELLQTYNGKGIWIVRDYFDVINSALRRFREHKKELSYILFDKNKAGWRVENISENSLQLINKYYKNISDSSARGLMWYIRNNLYFEKNISEFNKNGQLILVKYEDLVNDPISKFKYICDFLGISFNDKIVGDIFSTSIRRNHVPDIDPSVIDLCESLKLKFEQEKFI